MFCFVLFCFFFLPFDWNQLAKNRQHYWMESLKVTNVVKLESYLLKANEDTTTRSRLILQTFVRQGIPDCKISLLCGGEVSPLKG